MLRNYFNIAWRNLRRNRGFTLLNILGLSIGMVCFMLILLYVKDELSYDTFHEKADQIHRVALERKYPERVRNYAIIPQSYAETMVAEYDEVLEACRLFNFGPANTLLRRGDQTWRENDITWADSNFFSFFNIPMLTGDGATALIEPNSVVLTESMAEKYFGANWRGQSIVGEVIERIQNEDNYVVSGVCEDVPSNSHLQFNMLVASSGLGFLDGDPNYLSFSAFTYLMLDEAADPARLEAQFPDLVVKYASGPVLNHFGVDYPTYQANGNGYVYTLQALPNIYLDSNLEGEMKPPGSRQRIYFFSLIALLIIVIAGINFMNLATARSANRAREVGIRKTLGSEKSQLVAQFLSEAILISSLAAAIAAVVLFLVLPGFNELTEKSFDWRALFAPSHLLILMGLALLTGLASGIYPAVFLSSFRPIEVLRGKFMQRTKGLGLRNLLVVFQFAISIFLIASTVLIFKQLEFMQNKALGFDKESLVSLQNTGGMTTQQFETFLHRVQDLPGVVAASGCNSMPGQFYFGISFRPDGTNEMTTGSGLVVSEGFVECMRMELVDGREFSRDFADSLSVIVNEAAVRELGMENPIGQRLYTTDNFLVGNDPDNPPTYEIVGVLKDYHFQSLHHTISPLFLVNHQRNGTPGVSNLITVRMEPGATQGTLRQIEGVWSDFQAEVPFSYLFMDREWANLYSKERTARKVFSLFTILAILIACLGLFGLAAFMVEQRTKEVSIRKVLGATTAGIINLLSKDFLKLVFVALVIATPLAYFFIQGWLQDFAYRIDISWWAFALSGIIAIGIAFLTVSFQSIRAALADPVKNLRSD